MMPSQNWIWASVMVAVLYSPVIQFSVYSAQFIQEASNGMDSTSQCTAVCDMLVVCCILDPLLIVHVRSQYDCATSAWVEVSVYRKATYMSHTAVYWLVLPNDMPRQHSHQLYSSVCMCSGCVHDQKMGHFHENRPISLISIFQKFPSIDLPFSSFRETPDQPKGLFGFFSHKKCQKVPVIQATLAPFMRKWLESRELFSTFSV